jgi:hypothetical protein
MTRFQVKTIGVVLFLIGVMSVIYKTQVLNVPIMPKVNYDSWNITYNVELRRDRDNVNLRVPNILTRDYQTVTTKDTKKKDIVLKGNLKQGVLFTQDYSIQFHKRIRRGDVDLKGYATFKESNEDVKSVSGLYSKLLTTNSTNREFVKHVEQYVLNEVSRAKNNVDSISKAILTETASLEEKALIYHYLMLRKGIPSRIVAGINLNTKELQKITTSVESSVSLVNQVFLGTKWHTTSFNSEEGDIDLSRFVVITDNFLKYKSLFDHETMKISFLITPGTVSGADGVSFNKFLKQKSAFYSSFNLFSFPNELQRFYFYILIIPFGTLILAFCRNIVGIKTFGIFMPILLGLFLASSGFFYGLLTLLLVVLLGLVERYVLDKFYLLAVPRLSIILTLIVMLFLGMGIMSVNFDFFKSYMFSGVPIVILAVFVETLSVQLLEEGIVKSLPPILGTLFIAILSYALYQILYVRVILFTHPELLVSIIGLLILIGSYHGYRISELIRFKSFIEESKNA